MRRRMMAARMTGLSGVIALVGVGLLCLGGLATPASAQDDQGPIMKQLADGIYGYYYNFYSHLIVVTDDGVILTDPSGEERAAKMREEIRKITDQPVVKVIYTHDHYDHSAGGQIFKDEGAEFIAHEGCRMIMGLNPFNNVVPPNILYSGDRYHISHGGKQITLRHFGPSDGNCMSVVYVPEAKVLLVADIHVPFGLTAHQWLTTGNYVGVYHTLKRIRDEIQFDHVIAAHAKESSPQALNENIDFVVKLYEAVFNGLKAGKQGDDLKKDINFPEYSHWWNIKEELPYHIDRMAYSIYHGG